MPAPVPMPCPATPLRAPGRRRWGAVGAALLGTLLALPAAAFEPAFPFPATRTFAETLAPSSHRVAIGGWRGDALPSRVVEGRVTRRTWWLDAPDATTLEVFAPLRDQLVADGWEVVFECRTLACGGFDFRFDIDVTPAPEMFVDLADFRYLAARENAAWATLLVSRSGIRAHVQLTEVDPDTPVADSPDAAAPDTPEKSTSNEAAPDSAGPLPPAGGTDIDALTAALARSGRAVLSDLDFAIGATELGPGPHPSLAALAQWLSARPGATVALVGHTDAEGSAEGNRALSLRRARSVRDRLIAEHGVDPARVTAEGLGFFAPIDRNDTEAGRRANRRVEVVVTSTD